MKPKLSSGAALVALSALGYATNPIFGKIAYEAGANAISVGAIRFTVATFGIWLCMGAWRHALPVAKRLQLVAVGACGFAMVALLYFTAVAHIDASLATGLFYTHPAMIALFGRLRGERMSLSGYGGLLLTALGTWFLLGSGAGGGFTWLGAAMILAAAALYSAYMVLGGPVSKGVPPTVVSAHVTLGAALVYLALVAVTRPPVPGPLAFAAGTGLALCSTILAMITFFAGLPSVGATRAAIISTLEPVFTALLAVMMLGERLSLMQSFGMALVVAGAVAAQMKEAHPQAA